MKVALYMQDGLEQIVLTPESKSERALVERLHDHTRELTIKKGSFFECAGGWVRHDQGSDTSTMLVLRPRAEPQP